MRWRVHSPVGFDLGLIVVTEEAVFALQRTGCQINDFLRRHQDSVLDENENAEAWRAGRRIDSTFRLPDGTDLLIRTRWATAHHPETLVTWYPGRWKDGVRYDLD
jgi:hypothetical protein